MTLAEETILSGTRANSMYQPHTICGRASKIDMENYCAKESFASKNTIEMKPNAMKTRAFDKVHASALYSLDIR